jgi:hypothetical protein
MRYPLVLSALVVMCLLPACDDNAYECDVFRPADLTIHFVGFDDYAGQEFFLRVERCTNCPERQQSDEVYEELFRTSVVIPAGDFSIHRPGSVITCFQVHVDFFIDVNDNGIYDAPPTDHAWRINDWPWEDDNIEGTVTVNLDPTSCTYESDYPDNCAYGDIEWPVP